MRALKRNLLDRVPCTFIFSKLEIGQAALVCAGQAATAILMPPGSHGNTATEEPFESFLIVVQRLIQPLDLLFANCLQVHMHVHLPTR